MEHKKVVIVTQARIGSTRFPGKVLKNIGNDSLLSIHIRRLKKAELASEIIVATTHENGVEAIVNIAREEGVDVFQGSTNDVLDRFYQAAKSHNPDYVVRVTSDCPLIDSVLIDNIITMAIKEDLDYASNVLVESFPDGQDIEVMSWSALEKAWKDASLDSDREHVTPYIRNHSTFKGGILFKSNNYLAEENYNSIRMTVDEYADWEAITLLIDKFGVNETWKTYAEYILQHVDEFTNQTIIRNEGYLKSIKNESR